MQMKQPTTVREAKSMVKERWLDRRVEKLSKENDELREAVDELRRDLDEEHGRSKETLQALSKSKRPGRMKWLVLAGGAYVLGAKAGRARYEQIRGWTRSVTRSNGNGTAADTTTDTTGKSTGV
jgi:cell division septum initiation protein DivIVA